MVRRGGKKMQLSLIWIGVALQCGGVQDRDLREQGAGKAERLPMECGRRSMERVGTERIL